MIYASFCCPVCKRSFGGASGKSGQDISAPQICPCCKIDISKKDHTEEEIIAALLNAEEYDREMQRIVDMIRNCRNK